MGVYALWRRVAVLVPSTGWTIGTGSSFGAGFSFSGSLGVGTSKDISKTRWDF